MLYTLRFIFNALLFTVFSFKVITGVVSKTNGKKLALDLFCFIIVLTPRMCFQVLGELEFFKITLL